MKLLENSWNRKEICLHIIKGVQVQTPELKSSLAHCRVNLQNYQIYGWMDGWRGFLFISVERVHFSSKATRYSLDSRSTTTIVQNSIAVVLSLRRTFQNSLNKYNRWIPQIPHKSFPKTSFHFSSMDESVAKCHSSFASVFIRWFCVTVHP